MIFLANRFSQRNELLARNERTTADLSFSTARVTKGKKYKNLEKHPQMEAWLNWKLGSHTGLYGPSRCDKS